VPPLAHVPAIVYFHENQFVYPLHDPDQRHRSNIVNAQLNSILTASVADTLVFNSAYNFDTFSEGVRSFIKRMPDGLRPQMFDEFRQKSSVLPVPIASLAQAEDLPQNKVREIVWNHRWEYDKQPEVLFDALYRLKDKNIPFKLHVVGQSFRSIPDCFAEAEKRLATEIVTWGHQPRAAYLKVLQRADIVASTALHDFQGLGMLEAIYRSCVPVAPRRMAYPEYVPENLLYDTTDEVDALTALLKKLLKGELPEVPVVDPYLDVSLKEQYRDLIDGVLNSG